VSGERDAHALSESDRVTSAWNLRQSNRIPVRAEPGNRTRLVACGTISSAPSHGEAVIGGPLALLPGPAVGRRLPQSQPTLAESAPRERTLLLSRFAAGVASAWACRACEGVLITVRSPRSGNAPVHGKTSALLLGLVHNPSPSQQSFARTLCVLSPNIATTVELQTVPSRDART
jgi:hypothetical protein